MSEATPAHRHNLLFVEDDYTTREFLMALARSVGLEAVACDNGRSALDMLRRGFRPCLIVLDVAMPDMDGFAFRREQMADPALRCIAVAIMSGGGWAAEADARMLGPAVFLHKPVDPERLLKAFEDHCGARRSN